MTGGSKLRYHRSGTRVGFGTGSTRRLPIGPIRPARRRAHVKRSISLLCTVAVACVALAESTSADTAAQIQFAGLRAPDDPNVEGFRFSLLYGDGEKMSGFDLAGAVLVRSREFSGAGPWFATAYVEGDSNGCLCSFANFVEGTAHGVTLGFINVVGDAPKGANIGFVNVSQGATAFDLSGIVVSKRSKVQIGFINMTEHIENVQIGFLNIASNGFLPVFPIFNFPKSSK